MRKNNVKKVYFGSEVWGMNEASDIELIHTEFLRRILGAKKSTNLIALYGELGRFPFYIIRKVHIIQEDHSGPVSLP